jgi:ornithine cyclodeaminase/alanine dehydrogenase-like protein (mu-crystallin family)
LQYHQRRLEPDSCVAASTAFPESAILILDLPAVRRLLSLPKLIAELRPALRAFSAGEVVQPVRTIVPVERHQGFLGLMPAYAGALGAKLVTFYPQNRDVPTHHALIVLFRPETGEPIAVMDGTLITEVRTAAVSAIATDLLAREDVKVLCLLGSGVQARSHLQALRLVRSFDDVRVFSPRNAAGFAREHGVRACASAEEAVRGADVVVVATSSRQPVLAGGWLRPGAHVNAVGACRPDWRELDDSLLRNARLFVDSQAAASVESGDIIAAKAPVTELGALIADTRLGRRSGDEVTLFKSLGLAVEDLVAATQVYRAACGERDQATTG